ncbi:hypothetical protein [Citrobacter freundii]|uniref:hypothetical protein n=1 Tax=Citrobacter freundii TaxID=546 RepID=UPI003D7E2114
MTTHDRKSCSACLTLVAPPISNSLASTITKDDAGIISRLRQSHFYMICGRAKAKFSKVTGVDNKGYMPVEINLDSGLSSIGFIHIPSMRFFRDAPDNFDLKIKSNEDFITVFYNDEIVFHMTPDELLMRRGRHENIVSGFDNYREIMTFDLLYVGIAKENQDSYNRLIAKGHKARMDILASEEQRTPGARVSDETYLLLFKVEPLTITTFSGSGDLDDDDLNFSIDYHRVVADAEKAVINAFKPKYNKQLYASYPKGTDGLYKQGYDGYSYAISEGVAFNTAYGTIKGARDYTGFLLSNDADFISVNGDEVTLHISGVDFNVGND